MVEKTQQQELKLEASWQAHLQSELDQGYMQQLRVFLHQEKLAGKEVYPSSENIFAALNSTPFDQVKVVVLGQDPYHGPGQAHGLCFSVLPSVKVPPSLMNIYKELNTDLNIPIPNDGCLNAWADQGVLLLNAVLTVEQSQAASHQGQGWERFTDRIVELLNDKRQGLVFLLWGAYAQKKGQFIDQQKHLVLKSAHPSPLSAYRGFLGNQHFSKTNTYLRLKGQAEIAWDLNS